MLFCVIIRRVKGDGHIHFPPTHPILFQVFLPTDPQVFEKMS